MAGQLLLYFYIIYATVAVCTLINSNNIIIIIGKYINGNILLFNAFIAMTHSPATNNPDSDSGGAKIGPLFRVKLLHFFQSPVHLPSLPNKVP